jgi:hypothetical protein
LLGQIGLNDVTVGDLVDELGLSGTGLGTILADGGVTTLGGLSNLLRLTGLNEGLGSALSTAGLLTGVLDTPTIEAALNAISLGTLLGDLGVGDLASITVDPFGGLITELVDIVPSQILAAL